MMEGTLAVTLRTLLSKVLKGEGCGEEVMGRVFSWLELWSPEGLHCQALSDPLIGCAPYLRCRFVRPPKWARLFLTHNLLV